MTWAAGRCLVVQVADFELFFSFLFQV